VIVVDDFHKAYDKTIAVAGLSFQLAAGRVLGLIGPNGAGKTTTLRALAGIVPASRGRLVLAGYDVQQQPLAAKQRLAYVPDDPQLFSELTIHQHLAFTASAYRVADAKPKAARLLEQFELRDKQRTPARDLSRGMRQKLAICCAYLRDPLAILFDEPLTGLDPRGIRQLKQSISQRARDGASVMISSHLLAMVEDICDEVLILDLGRPRFHGTLQQLKTAFNGGAAATLEDIYFRATADPTATGFVGCVECPGT
jgi:ABC-2 type transport system ATP-binding protein